MQHAGIKDEIAPATQRVVEAQHFIMGPEVQGLEEEIAVYCDATHAIGCGSGSDALLLSLMALKPVHPYGQAAPMDEILALARELGVPVIEDAAQAIGTRDSHGRRVETQSTLGCSRLDSLQAAILRVKLGHLDSWSERRRGNAARYAQLLGNTVAGLGPGDFDGLELSVRSPRILDAPAEHIFDQHVIRVPAEERD